MTMKDIGFTVIVLFLGMLIVAAHNSLAAMIIVALLVVGIWAWTLICERHDKATAHDSKSLGN